MFRSVYSVRVIILLLLICGILIVWFPFFAVSQVNAQYLTVRFFDVGQGDSIQVITPDGYEMLIDGGPSSAVLRELSNERSFFDKKIDVVIATHPDTDHVAGLVDVLERYEIGMFIETAVEHDAPAAVAYREAARLEKARLITAEAGQTIQLGASTTIRIFSPYGDATHWESNSASVVVQVTYGDIDFMLTGDAPSSIENYMVNKYGSILKSEVLKLGHHGSNTSSSELFLKAVKPEFAVVSAGKNNRYGHPTEEVINRVLLHGAKVLNTAEQGTIVFESDGVDVWYRE